MSIEDQIIEYSLPILSSGAEKEYLETVKALNEIIIQPEENEEFFASPTGHLKSKGLLTISEISLPNGDKVPLFDDETMAQTLREFRERYKTGAGLQIPTAILHKENVAIERRYAIYSDFRAIFVSDFQVAPDQLRELDINPLMSPLSRDKIRRFVESQGNKPTG